MTHPERQARRARVAAAIAAGDDPVEVAQRESLSPRTVYLIAPSSRIDERRKRIITALKSGKSIAEVCAAEGASAAVVRLAARDAGIGLPQTRKRTSLYAILAALLNTTETLEQIGARFGVSKQRVSEILQAARAGGIKVRI